MDPSSELPLNVNPLEKPIRTYQRSKKALFKSKVKQELNIKLESNLEIIDDYTCGEIQSKEVQAAESDNISISSTSSPEKLVINIKEVITSTVFDPELLNVVKPLCMPTSVTLGEPEISESENKLLRSETTRKTSASEEVVKSPTLPADPKRLEAESAKSERTKEESQKPESPEIVLLEPDSPEVVQLKPKVIETLQPKTDACKALKSYGGPPLSKLKDFPEVQLEARVSGAEQIKPKGFTVQLKPKVPEVVHVKLKPSDAVQSKLKPSEAVQSKPKGSGVLQVKQKPSEAVQSKPKYSGVLQLKPKFSEAVQLKRKGKESVQSKAKLKVKPNAPKSLLLKPKVVRTTLVKQKEPKPTLKPRLKVVAAKPSTTETTLVQSPSTRPVIKSQSSGASLLKLNRQGEKVLIKPEKKPATKILQRTAPKPTTPGSNSEQSTVPRVIKLNSSDNDANYYPGSKTKGSPHDSLLTPPPRSPPAVEAWPIRSSAAIKRLQEILFPLLPRHWSLRVENDGIFGMLFAPGLTCAVQRAIFVSFNGNEIRFIVHGRVIPKDHSVYEYRLMRSPLALNDESVEDFAQVFMGAVHSVIQHHVCIGVNDEELVRERRDHPECLLDDNFYHEEGYNKTLRSLRCHYLVWRKNTKRCSECLFYKTLWRSRGKRQISNMQVEWEEEDPEPKKSKALN